MSGLSQKTNQGEVEVDMAFVMAFVSGTSGKTVSMLLTPCHKTEITQELTCFLDQLGGY